MALAILAEVGLQEKLVHFDYNCILPKPDSAWERQAQAKLAQLADLHGVPGTTEEWEREHAIGVLGAAERYGFREEVFFDCQQDLEGAVESIRRAIDASSADDPLYFILAGPMEVPYLGIERSDPEKRQYVYCISHNNWNDGYASGDLVDHNKRDVIPLGVTWVQIRDQNPLLMTNPYGRVPREEEWAPWHWMRDSADANVRFLWERLLVSARPDISDAGMVPTAPRSYSSSRNSEFCPPNTRAPPLSAVTALATHGAVG